MQSELRLRCGLQDGQPQGAGGRYINEKLHIGGVEQDDERCFAVTTTCRTTTNQQKPHSGRWERENEDHHERPNRAGNGSFQLSKMRVRI